MRYLWTFIWSFFLVEMLTYVVSSMIGSSLDLKHGAIMSVVVTVFILIVSTLIPNENANQH